MACDMMILGYSSRRGGQCLGSMFRGGGVPERLSLKHKQAIGSSGP